MMRPTSRYFTRSAPLPTPSHRYVRVAHFRPCQRDPLIHALTRTVASAIQPRGTCILCAPTPAASLTPVTLPGQFHTSARRGRIAVRVGSAP